MALNEKSAKKDVPAIEGENTASGFGVSGKSDLGVGVHGENGGGNIGPDRGVGVWGESQNGFGVFGSSDHHRGVRGVSKFSVGVNGINDTPASIQPDRGCGVHGEAIYGYGVFGMSDHYLGVRGISKFSVGVNGINEAPATIQPDRGCGVHGEAVNGYGVFGMSDNHEGVRGASKNGVGVFGASEQGEGVHGETRSATMAAIAAFQLNPHSDSAALFAKHAGGRTAAVFEGNVVVTGDVVLANADCAEDFDIGETEIVEPGTVMVLGDEGKLRESRSAYDKRVAGVVSGAGAYKPGIVLDKQDSQEMRQPIALLGKVYCKVDAQYGSVDDLLTTAPTFGHAMKATDPLKAFGSVIGKALRPLKKGQGLIPILIALQ